MSMELCVVCDNPFDVDEDLAMFEPGIICGNCVQLVRDVYDEESETYAEAKSKAELKADQTEIMKMFDDLIAKFPTKVSS